MSAKKVRTCDPMKTKSGKTRLGPLNIAQLTTMLESAKKKHKPAIQRALVNRTKTQQVSTKVSAEVVAE
jgi:hypothetical protein